MKRRKTLGSFFTLLLVLLLTGCSDGSETPEITETVPATEETISEPDTEPTMVLAAPTVAPEKIDNDQEPTTAAVTATPEAPLAPELTPTPELRVFVTPKSRTQWRAGSGELFIPFENGIKNFQYYLYVPKEWHGFFEMRQDTDDIFLFHYLGEPDKKQEVFRVQAFPEQIWAEKKAAGDEGIQFYSLRNVTFVYYAASENPFSGEEAELFQKMIDDVPQIISEELEIVSRRFNHNE
ncbi:MAG: hypothetical protein ACPGWR_12295 [Ardenticatenaceae bacterium]